MLSSQIISSLFDFVRELFNTGNSTKRTKWYFKLVVGIIALVAGTMFITFTTLTKELYELNKENKRLEEKAKKLDILMQEYLAIKEVNTALISIIKINIPNSGAVLPKELVREIKTNAEIVTDEVIKPVERAKVIEELERETRKETGKSSLELDKEKEELNKEIAEKIEESASRDKLEKVERLELPKQSRRQRELQAQQQKK